MANIEIPSVLGSVKSAPANVPYANQRLPDNSEGIQQTAENFGRLGQQVGKQEGARVQRDLEYQAKLAEQKKQDADNVRVGDAMTALQKHGTDELYGTQTPDPDTAADAALDGRDPKTGYLASRGAKAGDDGVGTFERLRTKREQLLKQLDNEEQKKKFQALSDNALERYYAQIEQHTAQQQEQQKLDTLKNAEDQALRAATLDPKNDRLAKDSIANIVGLQDSFTTSTGDAFAKADAVQAKITMGRLEALLADPAGFTDAERVLEQNKGALGTKYDDYRKRVDAAKLGGTAVVEANRIVEKAMPESAEAQLNYRMPSDEAAFQELAKLPPKLQEKVAPLLAQRMAMRKAAIKEQRDAFIDRAKMTYNRTHGTFFASDMAERLNKVDPDAYRSMWNETFQRWKAAGDDSPKARREQAARDRLALRKYKAYGDGDINARVGLNPETFVTGMGVSDDGLAAIMDAHAVDVAARDKGVEEGQKRFVAETRAQLQNYAPNPGTTKQSKAAARQWWAEKTAAAVDAYTDWANDPKNVDKRAPSREEAAKLRAGVILDQPVDPSRPESLKANVDAVTELAAPPKLKPPMSGGPEMVPLIGPKGQKGKAPAAGLDAWLTAHPGWKRGP